MNPFELLKEQARRSLEHGWKPHAQQVLSDSRIVVVTALSGNDNSVEYSWSVDGTDVSEEIAEREMRQDKHLRRSFNFIPIS